MNGLASLLRQTQGAGKQLLLIYAEEIFLREFIASRTRAAKDPKVKDHNVLLAGIDAVQHRGEVIKRIGVPDHHERVPRANAKRGRSQFSIGFQVKHVEFLVLGAMFKSDFLGDLKYCKKDYCERHARNGCHLLGEKIHDAQGKERRGNQPEPQRELHVAHREIQGYTKIPLSWLLVPK